MTLDDSDTHSGKAHSTEFLSTEALSNESFSNEAEANVLSVRVGGVSLSGKKDVNEDSFAVHQAKSNELKLKGIVACIADGASCSDDAQLASQTSVTSFIEDYYATPESWGVKESAAKVLSSLNSWLFNTGSIRARPDSLVTTFSAIIFKSSSLHALHVGDSRISRLRDGQLQQLTRDHTHLHLGSQRVLTRALGLDSHLEVDYAHHSLRKNDLLLLTTDGVHEFISKSETKNILLHAKDSLEDTARDIVNLALSNGSDDNLSCLLVEVTNLPIVELDDVHHQLTQLVIPPVMEPGMKIDNYKIIRVLHSGTRSHIYQVEHLTTLEKFALKAPSRNFSEDPLYLESFHREQWIGRRVKHEGLMKIYPRSSICPYLYHICEYIDGQTLRQWMLDNPQPSVTKIRDIVRSIVIALRALQRMSMVHRDLKPENVMLCADGTAKVIDFGTVYVNGLQETNSLLKEEIPVGSINYTSPETLQSVSPQSSSDLYALGVMTYEMLCGELPYKEPASAVMAVKTRSWHYRSLRSRRTDIPVWLDLALEKSVEPDPDKRQQAFSEFIQDISVPNKRLVNQHEAAPLLQRNPTLFWQCTSAVLFILLIVAISGGIEGY